MFSEYGSPLRSVLNMGDHPKPSDYKRPTEDPLSMGDLQMFPEYGSALGSVLNSYARPLEYLLSIEDYLKIF